LVKLKHSFIQLSFKKKQDKIVNAIDINEVVFEEIPNTQTHPTSHEYGTHAEVLGSCLDNWYVVPYNPYLLAKFICHINIEVCTIVKSVNTFINMCMKGMTVHLMNWIQGEMNN
jgi:hypothetical protein